MGPAIALRLRQHLTLTPQVQQALRLLQMSALEFAQEMDQALTANPFLEENPEAPPAGASEPGDTRLDARVEADELRGPQASGPAPDRPQEDWGGV
jgi:RNA polymerase sigma-54 factor